MDWNTILLRVNTTHRDGQTHAISNKMPRNFLSDVEELIFKCIWKCKGLQAAKTFLKGEKKVGGFTLLDFRTYYKATTKLIKTAWCWHNDEHRAHWDRTESPEISPCIWNIGGKKFHKWCWHNWKRMPRMKLYS